MTFKSFSPDLLVAYFIPKRKYTAGKLQKLYLFEPGPLARDAEFLCNNDTVIPCLVLICHTVWRFCDFDATHKHFEKFALRRKAKQDLILHFMYSDGHVNSSTSPSTRKNLVYRSFHMMS